MKYIKLVVLLLALTSCVEVVFEHPMPPKGETLESIPSEIVTYFMSLKKDSLENSALNIDWNEPLPEGIILKKWKKKYFLNLKEKEFWKIYIVKPESDNTFNVYQLDGSNKATVEKLKSITELEEFFDDAGDLDYVILNPTFKEFKKIIKSNAFQKIDLFDE